MSDADPRRILYLVNDAHFFCSHRMPLAEEVQKTGAQVFVAVPPGERQVEIENAGFIFVPVRFRRKSLNPLHEFITILDVLKAYRIARPHLVHHVTLKPIIYGSIAAAIAKVPAKINAVTGLGYVFAGKGLRRNVLRKIAELGYRIALRGKNSRAIFQNPDDRELFVGKGLVRRASTRVIFGSGVNPDQYVPTPETQGPIRILLPARMLWDKGIGDLIEAGRLLRGKQVAFEIVLAGVPDPDNPASIDEQQLKAWEEEGIAKWVGYRVDMPELYRSSHIVCLPSYREGVPLSLIEAASCGRPIVATDVPGCREIVYDGVNGLLVPPRQPGNLAGALAKLISDPSRRKEMGRRGRDMVLETFTLDVVVSKTLAVYEELLGSHPPLSGCRHNSDHKPAIR